MSKRKKNRLGKAEFVGWGPGETPVVDDDFNWGMPEQDTPVESPPETPRCQKCRAEVEHRFAHYSAPDVWLCAKCYNVVAREHRPPSKRS